MQTLTINLIFFDLMIANPIKLFLIYSHKAQDDIQASFLTHSFLTTWSHKSSRAFINFQIKGEIKKPKGSDTRSIAGFHFIKDAATLRPSSSKLTDANSTVHLQAVQLRNKEVLPVSTSCPRRK